MQFAEKAKEVQEEFAKMGHQAFPSSFNEKYVGLSDGEKEILKLEHKYNHDAIREHWYVIQECNVALVLNYDTEIKAMKPIVLHGDLAKIGQS